MCCITIENEQTHAHIHMKRPVVRVQIIIYYILGRHAIDQNPVLFS
jgi:hypothetical protein